MSDLPIGWESRTATIPLDELADRTEVSSKVQLARMKSREIEDRETAAKKRVQALGLSDDLWANRQSQMTPQQLMNSGRALDVAVAEVVMTKGEGGEGIMSKSSNLESTFSGDANSVLLKGISRSLDQVLVQMETMNSKIDSLEIRSEMVSSYIYIFHFYIHINVSFHFHVHLYNECEQIITTMFLLIFLLVFKHQR
jgi:hypothetical protein